MVKQTSVTHYTASNNCCKDSVLFSKASLNAQQSSHSGNPEGHENRIKFFHLVWYLRAKCPYLRQVLNLQHSVIQKSALFDKKRYLESALGMKKLQVPRWQEARWKLLRVLPPIGIHNPLNQSNHIQHTPWRLLH